MMQQSSLAEKLRRLRAQHGYTLVEAAAKTGVDRGTLSSLERGVHTPYTPTLAKIARGYEIPVEELLEEEPVAAPLGEAPSGGTSPETGADQDQQILDRLDAMPTAEEMDEVTAALVRQVKYRLKTINRWREMGVDAWDEAACGWFDMEMANDQIFRELQKLGSDEVINNREIASPEDLKAALRQTDAFAALLGTAADARTVAGELSKQAEKEDTRIVEGLEDLLMATRDKRDS